MTILDLCAYLGLAAVGMATANMGLGLLIALRYSPLRLWPHRHINIFRLHNWTAYFVLLLIMLHPVVLLFRPSTHFGWLDVMLPVQSPVQPTVNTVGAAALYGLLVVIVTLSCLSWKWRKRSSVKITERTYEEGTEAFHSRGKSSHLEAASCGQSTRLGAV